MWVVVGVAPQHAKALAELKSFMAAALEIDASVLTRSETALKLGRASELKARIVANRAQSGLGRARVYQTIIDVARLRGRGCCYVFLPQEGAFARFRSESRCKECPPKCQTWKYRHALCKLVRPISVLRCAAGACVCAIV